MGDAGAAGLQRKTRPVGFTGGAGNLMEGPVALGPVGPAETVHVAFTQVLPTLQLASLVHAVAFFVAGATEEQEANAKDAIAK